MSSLLKHQITPATHSLNQIEVHVQLIRNKGIFHLFLVDAVGILRSAMLVAKYTQVELIMSEIILVTFAKDTRYRYSFWSDEGSTKIVFLLPRRRH